MIDAAHLAEPHKGMRVSASGLLASTAFHLTNAGEKGLAFSVQELKQHLFEMAARFYAGEVKVVDEFLQLYSLDDYRPGQPTAAPPASASGKPITIAAGLC